MRIISFCAIWVFLLQTYEVDDWWAGERPAVLSHARRHASSYGERFSSTLSCVSFRAMNKTGATAGRFHPPPAIYAAEESLSRPIVGHTPRKLPRFPSNLPPHRSAPTQALDYCTTKPPPKSSTFSSGGSSFFNGFAPPQSLVVVWFSQHKFFSLPS